MVSWQSFTTLSCLCAMASTAWLPVAFDHLSNLQSTSSGQLESVQASSSGSVAISDGFIDSQNAPHAGLRFELSSCVEGYSYMRVGLTQQAQSGLTDVNEPMDFSIRLTRIQSHVGLLQIEESGHEVCNWSCQGLEAVMIRLDEDGANANFFVNDTLVHTSSKIAKFPLLCKLAIGPRRTRESRFCMSDPGASSMCLPLANLEWGGMSFSKVLTLQVLDVTEDGWVSTACTDMGGAELARLKTEIGQKVAEFKESLVCQLKRDFGQLTLITEDGKLITSSDRWPLQGRKES
eukprot:TRINITY_DN5857_c0_g1_i7.p1 TRINITY_DN5857_c0_g1~~TRINITY_DN5857_c0_g1_i7.p1  ORF type:complete len:291 (+),score=36.22 TRINITY_DN5857_c0_g1_i7:29-901(+)